MAHDLFSTDWAQAWRKAIEASAAIKASRGWKWPLVLIARGTGVIEDRAVWLDLCDGECREARVATAADLAEAPFVLSADLDVWQRLLDRALEPIAGVMKGQLKLVRGSLAALLPYAAAAKELVSAATAVPTRFPERV